MAKLGLSAPWIIYYREVEALFSEDPGVRVIYDDEAKEVKLFVEDGQKAAALTELLPVEQEFGKVKLKVTVVPANKKTFGDVTVDKDKLFNAALAGNNALASIYPVVGVFSNPLYYVVFKKKVVQYYTDDLGDYHGLRSTLYQDIAKEIFIPKEGVFFCTDVRDSSLLGAPLGEWP